MSVQLQGIGSTRKWRPQQGAAYRLSASGHARSGLRAEVVRVVEVGEGASIVVSEPLGVVRWVMPHEYLERESLA